MFYGGRGTGGSFSFGKLWMHTDTLLFPPLPTLPTCLPLQCVKYFIEYQALVLSKLFPQPKELQIRLAERLLSHLMHEVVSLDFTNNHYQPTHWGEMKSSESRQLIDFFFMLISEVASSR